MARNMSKTSMRRMSKPNRDKALSRIIAELEYILGRSAHLGGWRAIDEGVAKLREGRRT